MQNKMFRNTTAPFPDLHQLQFACCAKPSQLMQTDWQDALISKGTGVVSTNLLRCDVAVAVHAAEDELHLTVTQ